MNHLIIFDSEELHSVCEINDIENEKFNITVNFNPPFILQTHLLNSPRRGWIEPSSGTYEITNTVRSVPYTMLDSIIDAQIWSIVRDVHSFRSAYGYGVDRSAFLPLVEEYARYGVII